jgi:hypothetical protein
MILIGQEISFSSRGWCGCEGEGVGVISIPHTPQAFTHVPNPQLPINSFSAMYSFGEIGIGKLRRWPKRIDFVSFTQ